MRVAVGTLMILGLAAPAFGQMSGPPSRMQERSQPPEQPQPKPADERTIVVTGIANGARIVEVDFDKVWKNCAECKRALAKLDKLAQAYRDESIAAREFATFPANRCNNASPSPSTSFQRSSAEAVSSSKSTTLTSRADGMCAARSEDQSKRTYAAVRQKYVIPEQGKLAAAMRSFLDQLAPHLREATEAERIANNASAGLTDAKRSRLSATRLKRIDVTQAVIRRLDSKAFTIDLPDPAPPGPAQGGYETPLGDRR